jgi:hypothetical protein
VKAMLLVFFDHQGIMHYQFAPEGQIFNQSEMSVGCGTKKAT